jgi:hypothetical protein
VKSWEVLREATEKVGVKALATKLNLSTALVYKWCQQPTEEDAGSSGALNPLDRLRTIWEVTRDARVINWVCNVADGFFVRNPNVKAPQIEEHLLSQTQRVVEDFGVLLSDISRGIQNDGQISAGEAEAIRTSWERLKGQAEEFVVACERGQYSRAPRR